MSARKFQFGDVVRHVKRPEWGLGSVVKAEDISINGELTQSVNVRFPNAGLKTLNSSIAQLELVDDQAQTVLGDDAESFDALHRMSQTEWLAPMAQKKIEQAMLSLPLPVRDVFSSLESRLIATIELFRFDRSGRGLIDWAVAQSSLDDPLSRFSRQELEQYFDRWAQQREQHLFKLMKEAAPTPELVRKHLDRAPVEAKQVLQRLTAVR